jgi:catechol 2,3-dioxygenase-like lactoylglutathione lyase family enzyme
VIQHVSLETRPEDVGAARAFWTLLGFADVEPPPSLARRSSWLQRGPTQVHLLLTDQPVAPSRGHVAVIVDDYDATLAALRAAGHDVDPRREHWGAPRAYVHAPGGHLVELMAAPPPG